MQERKVTVIPASVLPANLLGHHTEAKRRVAAYARVSTDSDEQLTSYEAQIDYYTSFISKHPDWEFAGMYSDEGISGVMTKNREGFNQMINDALAGSFDLIITKSISRFARNTVDMLSNVRLLKEHGIEVYFEKENIYSMDSKGEVLMTIMGSLAQEESRSISENVKWGQRKRFQDGKVSMPYKRFLGYQKGENGLPEVVPEEADTVKVIYQMFLVDGMTTKQISDELSAAGIKSPSGKDAWHSSTIKSILTNEKYRGSARLQKSFTVDYLTKKKKVNEGEVPQYYVEHSHPAIIDPEEWDEVQLEMERRKSLNGRYRNESPFSGKIVCGDCGSIYGSKVWHSTDKYRTVIWRCNDKYTKKTSCKTPHIKECDLIKLSTDVINEYLQDRNKIISDIQKAIAIIDKRSEIQEELLEIRKELEEVAEMVRFCIEKGKPIDGIEDRYSQLESKREELRSTLSVIEINIANLKKMVRLLKSDRVLPLEFDDRLWRIMIKEVRVYEFEMEFEFFDGTVIKRDIKNN